MAYHPLITLPHVVPGGVIFTVDELDLGPVVFVTDAALERLVPNVRTTAERLSYVLLHAGLFAEAARQRRGPVPLPELIVFEPCDVAAFPPIRIPRADRDHAVEDAPAARM